MDQTTYDVHNCLKVINAPSPARWGWCKWCVQVTKDNADATPTLYPDYLVKSNEVLIWRKWVGDVAQQ